MSQEIIKIPVKDLISWTENPRDPLSSSACNQDIVDMALRDSNKKWDLKRFASTMGDTYDMSEFQR